MNQRKGMTIENISWPISTKECCRTWQGSNLWPPDHQSDTHPTEPPRLADQTAPSRAIWSGSTLFACAILSETLVYKILDIYHCSSNSRVIVLKFHKPSFLTNWYMKQCRPRPDCSFRSSSSLIRSYTFCHSSKYFVKKKKKKKKETSKNCPRTYVRNLDFKVTHVGLNGTA